MKKYSAILFLAIFSFFSCTTENKYVPLPTQYVNPFIGTGGHGHTFPGAALPFGMVQLSPDTRLTGWDGCSGYHYTDSVIYGFSHTHLSGTGIPDYCDILVMPTIGKFVTKSGYIDEKNKTDNGYGSYFKKENEQAKAGYYSVILDKYGIFAELTTTKRVGFHRYTFPKSDSTQILIDLTHRDVVINSGINIENDSVVSGFRISAGWARKQYIFFYAVFSKPFNSYILSVDKNISDTIKSIESKDIKAAFYFDTQQGETILMKVGISAVSVEGAKKNLEAELNHWNFDKTVQQADSIWNKELAKIDVEGTPQQLEKFYTSLYHSFLNPNLFMDVDGKYRGTDLKIHKADNFTNYTVFSLWDTYRATHPLFSIVQQKRTNDFIRTFINQYENGGQLPMWELAGNYTYCMIGYHSVPVIADAYIKGIRDYDAEKAFAAMKAIATQNNFGKKDYVKFGFLPQNIEAESVSKTLEYAYDDWTIAQMAKAMNKNDDYKQYLIRAQFYKNILDPETKFARPKRDGLFVSPFEPAEVNFSFTEANSWQYTFYVPQDLKHFADFFGGNDYFAKKLDDLFTASSQLKGRQQADITGLIGQYAHGNEPSHHIAYLYVFAQQPWKTQALVRRIMDEFYTTKPDGLIGNEDCGQMSSWYNLSALGFYQVTPATDYYIIGSPNVNSAIIKLENGKEFRITVENYGKKNVYVKSLKLNGYRYNKPYIRHKDIMQGGTLTFVMSDKPNKKFGTEDIPYTSIDEYLITPNPYAISNAHTFIDSIKVELACMDKNAKIYYTLDGTEPNTNSPIYDNPFIFTKSTEIRFFATSEGKIPSKISKAYFKVIDKTRKIKIKNKYSSQYTAGGDYALIDGISGGTNFRSGTWQGYYGVDLDNIIDLGKVEKIEKIAVRCLQDIDSWIFMPDKVEFYVSGDGKNFSKIATINNDVPEKKEGAIVKEFSTDKKISARYIRIYAKNKGVCPPWHKGAGGKTWIFADEIIIK